MTSVRTMARTTTPPATPSTERHRESVPATRPGKLSGAESIGCVTSCPETASSRSGDSDSERRIAGVHKPAGVGRSSAPSHMIEKHVDALAACERRADPPPGAAVTCRHSCEQRHVVRTPFVQVIHVRKAVERVVVPADASQLETDTPRGHEVVDTQPVSRPTLADGGTDDFPTLRVPLGDRPARVERRQRPVAIAGTALEIG